MTFTKADFENFIQTLNHMEDEFYCSEQEFASDMFNDFEKFMKRKNKSPEELNAVAYLESLGYTVTEN